MYLILKKWIGIFFLFVACQEGQKNVIDFKNFLNSGKWCFADEKKGECYTFKSGVVVLSSNGLDNGLQPFRLLSYNSNEKTLRVRMLDARKIYIFQIYSENEVSFQLENKKQPAQKLFRE